MFTIIELWDVMQKEEIKHFLKNWELNITRINNKLLITNGRKKFEHIRSYTR